MEFVEVQPLGGGVAPLCPQPSVTVGMPRADIQLASRPPLEIARMGWPPRARMAASAAGTEGSSSPRRNDS